MQRKRPRFRPEGTRHQPARPPRSRRACAVRIMVFPGFDVPVKGRRNCRERLGNGTVKVHRRPSEKKFIQAAPRPKMRRWSPIAHLAHRSRSTGPRRSSAASSATEGRQIQVTGVRRPADTVGRGGARARTKPPNRMKNATVARAQDAGRERSGWTRRGPGPAGFVRGVCIAETPGG